MVASETDESSLLLDEKLLQFMEQLEKLEEKRATLNSLIEQVTLGNKQAPSDFIFLNVN